MRFRLAGREPFRLWPAVAVAGHQPGVTDDAPEVAPNDKDMTGHGRPSEVETTDEEQTAFRSRSGGWCQATARGTARCCKATIAA